jgi:N-acetyltransferase
MQWPPPTLNSLVEEFFFFVKEFSWRIQKYMTNFLCLGWLCSFFHAFRTHHCLSWTVLLSNEAWQHSCQFTQRTLFTRLQTIFLDYLWLASPSKDHWFIEIAHVLMLLLWFVSCRKSFSEGSTFRISQCTSTPAASVGKALAPSYWRTSTFLVYREGDV